MSNVWNERLPCKLVDIDGTILETNTVQSTFMWWPQRPDIIGTGE